MPLSKPLVAGHFAAERHVSVGPSTQCWQDPCLGVVLRTCIHPGRGRRPGLERFALEVLAVLNLPHPDILLWSGGLAMSERRGDEGTSLGKTLGTLPVFVPEVLELREWRDIQDLRRRHRLQRFSGFRVTRSKVCYFTKI